MTKIKAYELNNQMWVNVSLLAIITVLALYYVTIANSVTSKNYQLSTLHDKLLALQEENSILSAKKLSFEDMPRLVEFAKASSMIENGNVAHIFEKKSVALIP